MRNTLLILLFALYALTSAQAQDKTGESLLFNVGLNFEAQGHMLFPNPSLPGQDVFIESGTCLGNDWWMVVFDANGKEIKGISAVQEGGRIRIHGQVPKPGIYLVRYGNSVFRSNFRWIVSD
jgi:hypothetical protein